MLEAGGAIVGASLLLELANWASDASLAVGTEVAWIAYTVLCVQGALWGCGMIVWAIIAGA